MNKSLIDLVYTLVLAIALLFFSAGCGSKMKATKSNNSNLSLPPNPVLPPDPNFPGPGNLPTLQTCSSVLPPALSLSGSGEAIGQLQLFTSTDQTVVNILERTGAAPPFFRILTTGGKNHLIELRYQKPGRSQLDVVLSDSKQLTSCAASTMVTAPPAPSSAPQCVLSVTPNRVLVEKGGIGAAVAQLTIPVSSGSVSEAFIGSLKLNPGQTTVPINYPAGTYTLKGRVLGPGGNSECSTTLEVVEATPTCQLVASENTVFWGTRISLTLVHLNPSLSGPLETSDIEGNWVDSGSSIHRHVWKDTTYSARVRNHFGESTCSVNVSLR